MKGFIIGCQRRLPLFAGMMVFAAALPALAGVADEDARVLQRNAAFRLHGSTLAMIHEEVRLPAHGQSVTVRVEAGDDSMDLVLDRSDPRSPGYQLLAQGADGSLVPVKPGQARTLSGHIAGKPGSRVAATLTDNGLIARLRFPENDPRRALGDFWIEPVGARLADAAAGEHVLYSNADVIPTFRVCATEPVVRLLEQDPPADEHRPPIAAPFVPRRAGASTGIQADESPMPSIAMDAGGDGGLTPHLFVAQLGCDADYEYFLAYGGSVEAVEERILSLINIVNMQYIDEVQIRHDISAIIVRTAEPDPYTATNSSQLLAEFRLEWQTNQQHIPHAVAMLFTGRDIDGSILGQASTIGGICTPLKYCHGQIECCGSTACATDLIAHELGHLWGGWHCSCSNPSFTMNPFITCANTFQPTVTRPSLTAHRDSRSCLTVELTPGVPFNDVCGLATDLPMGITEFSTANAFTSGPVTIEQCAQGVQREVWFRYRGQGFGFVTIDLCGSDFDTKIAVYKDNCPTNNAAYRCNDDAGCPESPFASSVTFPTAYGIDFFIEIGSPNGTTGNVVMTVTVEPFNQNCSADVNGDGIVDSDDLNIVLANYGKTGTGVPGDVNGNGSVGVIDLSILLSSFGNACP